jgi:HSP20 family protein
MTTVDVHAGGRPLPPHAHVREDATEYLVELDVSDFTERELTIELLGRHVTVRGEQLRPEGEETQPFRLHERLEETFRLPDDADVEELVASYRHGTLELKVPRRPLLPRAVEIARESSLVHPDAEGV